MEDIFNSKVDNYFTIITNDSDFTPLFKRVNLNNNLLWVSGSIKNRISKSLKENCLDNYINLYDLFLGNNYEESFEEFRLPIVNYWFKNQLNPLTKDNVYQGYVHDYISNMQEDAFLEKYAELDKIEQAYWDDLAKSYEIDDDNNN